MKNCPTCQQTYSDDVEYCPRDGAHLIAQATQTEAQIAAGLSRRFRIVRRLGTGGMGTVFLAQQIGVGNRSVALKILRRQLLEDPEFLLRFEAEAASTGRIHHPNVVTVYESGQGDDGTPYIAMEFLEGETLRQALKWRGPVPVAEGAEILTQAARGLNSAHKLGMIHRDLKPDNIFLTHGDEGELIVKIVDFGISKLKESVAHTQAGMVLGTPPYMSSEQASGMPSDQLDARSDVYSLGVVAYEMLSGRLPFQSTTPLGYLRKHMLDDPPPFRTAAPGVSIPRAVEETVMQALKKEREDRYPTALDFARAFAAAVAAAEVNQALPSTKVVVAPAASEPVALRRRVTDAKPEAKVAVQTPPPIAKEKRSEVPSAPPKPAPAPPEANRPPAPASPPHFRTVESSGWIRYVIVGLAVIVVLTAIAYYLLKSPVPPPGPTSEATGGARPPSVNVIEIPGATFTMGRNNPNEPQERPPHLVAVAAFKIDKRPVTNTQYVDFVRKAGHRIPNGWANGNYPQGQAEWPVTGVSWQDANDYCASKGERLPTEAEWEYAARGTDGRVYPWGSDFSSTLTDSAEAALGRPEAVGAHHDAVSPFGVMDMSGNVWEWTADDYKPYPGGNAAFTIPADAKVIRGGSYQSDRYHVTATTRNLDHASTRSAAIGFRCAQ